MSLKNILTPRGFLTVGGCMLVLLAVLGYVGVIGPTPDQSIFTTFWWFDNRENGAHLVLGIVALIAVYLNKAGGLHKILCILVGLLGIAVGIYSLFGSVTEGVNLFGAQLQNPADTLLNLVLGAWGLYVGFITPRKAK